MNNRRDFLKTLALALAATQLPLPKPSPGLRINPAWVNAPYEVQFVSLVGMKKASPICFRRGDAMDDFLSVMPRDAYPLRMSAAGEYPPPFIEI